ncbi:MAG: NAD-dependent epimerase/dehydratase family protein [Bacteroides sp.]|nr:NAD-dependent epimerase/dehydratase family protein [Bacteroides sp.]
MILVTGGTGLVGSHMLFELIKSGYRVRATRRKNSQLDLVKKLFEWYDADKGKMLFDQIDWVEADVIDMPSLQEAIRGVKAVFHCAAMVSFLPADRERMMKVNVEGTANLVNAALVEGVEKFCHCSSVSTIGQPEPGQPATESLVWKTSPSNSWYAISKFGAEREVWRGSEEGLSVVMVNPSIIIGPGDTARSSSQLYQSVKNGLKFYTKGITGFIDARDVALAMKLLYESPVINERFIMSSENIQYRQVFDYFAEFAGVEPPKYFAGPFLSEMAWRLEKLRSLITGKKPLITRETARNANNVRFFSSEKIKKALGFTFRPVKEAAQNTAGFYKKFPEAL